MIYDPSGYGSQLPGDLQTGQTVKPEHTSVGVHFSETKEEGTINTSILVDFTLLSILFKDTALMLLPTEIQTVTKNRLYCLRSICFKGVNFLAWEMRRHWQKKRSLFPPHCSIEGGRPPGCLFLFLRPLSLSTHYVLHRSTEDVDNSEMSQRNCPS